MVEGVQYWSGADRLQAPGQGCQDVALGPQPRTVTGASLHHSTCMPSLFQPLPTANQACAGILRVIAMGNPGDRAALVKAGGIDVIFRAVYTLDTPATIPADLFLTLAFGLFYSHSEVKCSPPKKMACHAGSRSLLSVCDL